MSTTQCQFSLVRYVPDAIKNEFVNIGVVVRGGGSTAVRFTRDWSRVRCVDPDADVAMLESLEEEIRQRLQGKGHALEKPLWEMFEDSLSNSVQLSESKGCLASSVADEVEQLLQMYCEPSAQEAVARRTSGRTALVQQMRSEFEQAGVWPLLRKRIAASSYTVEADPLRIDCGYRPNGVIRMFHAVSLLKEVDSAKVLAYSLPQLAAGVQRREEATLQLNAVVEPLAEVAPDSEQLYRYGVDVMQQAGLRVLTTLELAQAAQLAREELRV